MVHHPLKQLVLFAFVLSTISTNLLAQTSEYSEKQQKYPESVKEYLEGLYSEEQQKYSFRADYPGGFDTWQAKSRPLLSNLIGLNNIAIYNIDFQPTVRFLKYDDMGSYTLQKGFIKTEPYIEIPFWLLIPKGKGPFPLAILPHGHDRKGHDTSAGVYHDEAHRQKTLSGDRDVAIQAVENGFIAIAPAVRGLASEAPGVPDIRQRHGDRDCRSQFMHCLLSGRTAIGERVWDMSRIIDWATTLPRVDSRTILMMGNSGGGMVTLYAAACDERITILLTVNGVKDKLHTVDDINRAADRVRVIYSAANVPSHYEHRWGTEGHRFYKNLMWPFINQSREK